MSKSILDHMFAQAKRVPSPPVPLNKAKEDILVYVLRELDKKSHSV